MRHCCLTVLLLVATFGSAKADDADDFKRLHAALTLWEVAIAENRADLAIAAVEVIADISPEGGEAWSKDALVEIRLLALGNTALLERVSGITFNPANPAIRLQGAGEFTLPEDKGIGRVGGVATESMIRLIDRSGTTCAQTVKHVFSCNDKPLTGDVQLQGLTERGHIAIELLDRGAEN